MRCLLTTPCCEYRRHSGGMSFRRTSTRRIWRFAGRGCLSVRCTDGKFVQTLKADRRSGVTADRAEWEWQLVNDKPHLDLLTETPIASELPSEPTIQPAFDRDRSDDPNVGA
jgi:hypothetical protein